MKTKKYNVADIVKQNTKFVKGKLICFQEEYVKPEELIKEIFEEIDTYRNRHCDIFIPEHLYSIILEKYFV